MNFLYDADWVLCEEKVFLLTPDESAAEVAHQYGCVACRQLRIKAAVRELEGEEARLALVAAACRNDWNALPAGDEAKRLGSLLGSPVAEVHEGLIALADGRMVTILNCD